MSTLKKTITDVISYSSLQRAKNPNSKILVFKVSRLWACPYPVPTVNPVVRSGGESVGRTDCKLSFGHCSLLPFSSSPFCFRGKPKKFIVSILLRMAFHCYSPKATELLRRYPPFPPSPTAAPHPGSAQKGIPAVCKALSPLHTLHLLHSVKLACVDLL